MYVKCISEMGKKESVDTGVEKPIQSSLSHKNYILLLLKVKGAQSSFYLCHSSSYLFREIETKNRQRWANFGG